MLARERAQFLGREQIADRAAQVREAEHLGPRRDRLAIRVDVVLHARVRVLLRHRHHGEAKPLGFFVPRREVAGVVVLEDDHFVAGLRSMPLDTMLLASLVFRVMTISSGVTRRNSAMTLRVASFSPPRRARFCADGSRSTLSVSRFSASSTG